MPANDVKKLLEQATGFPLPDEDYLTRLGAAHFLVSRVVGSILGHLQNMSHRPLDLDPHVLQFQPLRVIGEALLKYSQEAPSDFRWIAECGPLLKAIAEDQEKLQHTGTGTHPTEGERLARHAEPNVLWITDGWLDEFARKVGELVRAMGQPAPS